MPSYDLHRTRHEKLLVAMTGFPPRRCIHGQEREDGVGLNASLGEHMFTKGFPIVYIAEIASLDRPPSLSSSIIKR